MEDRFERFRRRVDATASVHPRLLEDLAYRPVGGARPRLSAVAALAVATLLVVVGAFAVVRSARPDDRVAVTSRPTATVASVAANRTPAATPTAAISTPEPTSVAPVAPEPTADARCVRGEAIQEANGFKLRGVTYYSGMAGWSHTAAFFPGARGLGEPYGTIEQMAAPPTRENQELREGEATVLPAGTTVYAVDGYTPGTRLAAVACDAIYIYDVADNPAAKRGEDLFDIRGKVRWIEVVRYDPPLGPRPPAARAVINDDGAIRRTVDALLAAPIRPRQRGADVDYQQPEYYVHFALADGTEQIVLYAGDRVSASVPYPAATVLVPAAFRDAIEGAVRE